MNSWEAEDYKIRIDKNSWVTKLSKFRLDKMENVDILS